MASDDLHTPVVFHLAAGYLTAPLHYTDVQQLMTLCSATTWRLLVLLKMAHFDATLSDTANAQEAPLHQASHNNAQ
jgi:hypothetical protein